MAIFGAIAAIIGAGVGVYKNFQERDAAYKKLHDYRESHNYQQLWNKDLPDITEGSADLSRGWFIDSRGDRIAIDAWGNIVKGANGELVYASFSDSPLASLTDRFKLLPLPVKIGAFLLLIYLIFKR